MKKLTLLMVLLIGNFLNFAMTTKSRLKRDGDAEEYFFSSSEIQDVARSVLALPKALEATMHEIKIELRNEIREAKSELQNKLEEIKSQIFTLSNGLNAKILTLQELNLNYSLNDEKLDLKLEKLGSKMDSCSSMIISLGKTMNRIMRQDNNSRKTFPDKITNSKLEKISQCHLSMNNTAENIVKNGQLLTATYLDVKLPLATVCPRPFYDGKDSVYLFGGCSDVTFTNILKFSVFSETLEKVGSLQSKGHLGTVQSDEFGNIFYLGGGNGYNDVYKFDPAANTTAAVATLPYDIKAGISMKYNDSSNTVLILGGYGQGTVMLNFNLETLNSSTVSTNFPFEVNGGTSIRIGNKAFIFDDTVSNNRQALELDLDTYDTRKVGPGTLPLFDKYPSAVWDGNFVYIIGGYQGNHTDGIIQFNPITHENNFIQIQNFPGNSGKTFYPAPASVFVPNKNRIYCFGGQSYQNGGYSPHDKIFYIDLTPLSLPLPTTTSTRQTPEPTNSTIPLNPNLLSCNNRTNGLHPHPWDCSQFIGCREGEMSIFSCAAPLLFNPLSKGCDFPDQVQCSTFCVDKPNGTYPHFDDPSMNIICRSEVTNIFECSPPLLFDPDRLHCDYPELVSCSNSTKTNL